MCLYNPRLRLIRSDFTFGTTGKALFPYFARVTLFDKDHSQLRVRR